MGLGRGLGKHSGGSGWRQATDLGWGKETGKSGPEMGRGAGREERPAPGPSCRQGWEGQTGQRMRASGGQGPECSTAKQPTEATACLPWLSAAPGAGAPLVQGGQRGSGKARPGPHGQAPAEPAQWKAADPTSTRRGGWAGEGQTWGQTDPCGSAGISQKPQTGYQRGPGPIGCTLITGMFSRLSNMWPLVWRRN